MRKTLGVALLSALLVMLATARSAPAKAATVKIIIAGPGLPSPIAVTDEQILSLSNVWAGQFLDASHDSLEKPPQGLPYELSFYVKLREDDLRLMYVVYYYPSHSKPGRFRAYVRNLLFPASYLSSRPKRRDLGNIYRHHPSWEQLPDPKARHFSLACCRSHASPTHLPHHEIHPN